MKTSAQRFRTKADLAELVSAFEVGTLPWEAWDHGAHLAVAAWYLYHAEEHDAARRMICGIRRFNHTNGVGVTRRGGYHETLTLFWMGVVRTYLRAHVGESRDLAVLSNGLLERYGGERNLADQFYSDERLWSPEARAHWVAPDLQPMEAVGV